MMASLQPVKLNRLARQAECRRRAESGIYEPDFCWRLDKELAREFAPVAS